MLGETTQSMLSALEKGHISAEALVKEHLDAIAQRDGEIGAFLDTFPEDATKEAHHFDQLRAAGEALPPLAGIPVAVKDNINIIGKRTTCASKFLEAFESPYNASAIAKLKAAGAVIVGKTNMDEFAMGSSTEHSALKRTVNPVAPEHVPGGSSGGSTAAVAAKMVPLALGSSTGGSIRQPAAYCGVVGMKPTYGRVSRFGLVAFGSSLDQIGPVANDVDGAARLYMAIAGHDPNDATSVNRPVEDVLANIETAPTQLRIGLPKEFLSGNLQPEIRAAMDRLVAAFQAAGATIVEVALPHTDYAIPAYYLIATAEASSNLARFDGVRYTKRASHKNLAEMYMNSRSEGFGMEVKRRILLGTYCLSSGYYEGYYLKAQQVRTKIIEDYANAYESVDVILAPTTPTTAFRIGAKVNDPMQMYLNDIYTVTANLAGIPALSLPAGKDAAGLPIGLQLMGPHFEEANLFRVAKQAESLLAGS